MKILFVTSFQCFVGTLALCCLLIAVKLVFEKRQETLVARLHQFAKILYFSYASLLIGFMLWDFDQVPTAASTLFSFATIIDLFLSYRLNNKEKDKTADVVVNG